MPPVQRLRIRHAAGTSLVLVRSDHRPETIDDLVEFAWSKVPALGDTLLGNVNISVAAGESEMRYDVVDDAGVHQLWEDMDDGLNCVLEVFADCNEDL
ncbi:hypothetical protein HDU93_005526, partial [Gonapodya sp. JEL0774]